MLCVTLYGNAGTHVVTMTTYMGRIFVRSIDCCSCWLFIPNQQSTNCAYLHLVVDEWCELSVGNWWKYSIEASWGQWDVDKLWRLSLEVGRGCTLYCGSFYVFIWCCTNLTASEGKLCHDDVIHVGQRHSCIVLCVLIWWYVSDCCNGKYRRDNPIYYLWRLQWSNVFPGGDEDRDNQVFLVTHLKAISITWDGVVSPWPVNFLLIYSGTMDPQNGTCHNAREAVGLAFLYIKC